VALAAKRPVRERWRLVETVDKTTGKLKGVIEYIREIKDANRASEKHHKELMELMPTLYFLWLRDCSTTHFQTFENSEIRNFMHFRNCIFKSFLCS